MKLALAIALPVPQGGAGGSGPPVNLVVPVISGYAVVGIALTASPGAWDGANPITYTYQWQVAGVNVGTNANTYTPVTGDISKTVTVTVSATNSAGGPIVATSAPTAAVVAAAAPVNTVAPVVEGEAKVGSQLRVTSPGTWTGQPPQAAMTYTYQWQRNGVDIDGANGEFYITKTQDINQNVWCRLTASNGVAPPGAANSNATNVYSLPVNTVPPVITGSGNDGTAEVGGVLQCSTGTWLGTGAAFSWAWRRDGSIPIGGSGNSYVVQAADDPGTIDCVVTKTNEYGGTSVASSNSYTVGTKP